MPNQNEDKSTRVDRTADARMPIPRRRPAYRYCGPCDRWLAARHRECPACGATTDPAEHVPAARQLPRTRFEAVCQQRDDLLTALKAVVSMHCRDRESGTYQDRIGAMELARAAISKAEGR